MAEELSEGEVAQEAEIVVTGAGTEKSSPETGESKDSSAEGDGKGESTETAEEAAAKQAKSKDRLTKRFGDLTRTIHEERAGREAAERRAAELEQRIRGTERAPGGGDGAPKLEDFKSYEDYADARAQHIARQEFRREAAAQAQRQAQERAVATASEIRAKWETAEHEFKDKVDDYDEVMADRSVLFSESLAVALLDSESGPAISYYLKKHPEEARAIAQASPVAAARAIGKLEAKLASAPQEKPKTSAPKPPKPVGASTQAGGIPDDLPIDEWIKRRNQQVLKRRS